MTTALWLLAWDGEALLASMFLESFSSGCSWVTKIWVASDVCLGLSVGDGKHIQEIFWGGIGFVYITVLSEWCNYNDKAFPVLIEKADQ